MKNWRNLIICFTLFGIFWFGLDKFLTQEVNKRYNYSINGDYAASAKDNGIILQQLSLNKGDIMLFGTSELASYVEQNPRSFFPNKQQPYMTNSIGHAGVLSLEQTLNINCLDYSKNQKVVYLMSFAWFTLRTVDSPTFYANFSKYKFYEYMTDPSVPQSDKIYVAARLGPLVQDYKNTKDLDAWAYAKLCGAFPSSFNTIQKLFSPYLTIEKAILGTRDKAQSFAYLLQKKPYKQKELKDIDWDKEYTKAYEQGKNLIHDTHFYFDDAYVNYMSDKIGAQQNSQVKNPNLLTSKEYEDYRLFLQTCKRKNIKPLIIIQSANGWYYDYVGISKESRDAVYQKVCSMAQEYGFSTINLSDLEYTPYAFYDAWHLGWKGWLYVDQKITEYFNTNH